MGRSGCSLRKWAGCVALLLGVGLLSAPAWGDTILLLDSEDYATDDRVTLEGTWQSSKQKSGYIGSNYLHDQDAPEAKSVTYEFTVPEAGLWDVQIIWTSDPNRAKNVPVSVTYPVAIMPLGLQDSSGTVGNVTHVDQSSGGGIWTSVVRSPLTLEAGDEVIVNIRNYNIEQGLVGGEPFESKVPIEPEDNTYVIADGVRLVLVPEPASAMLLGLAACMLGGRGRRRG